MRELGSPVHGLPFFEAVFAAFGARAQLVLVRKDAVPIGGLIALTFKNTGEAPASRSDVTSCEVGFARATRQLLHLGWITGDGARP